MASESTARKRPAAVAAVPDGAAALSADLDRINLAQALKDTDVATARVTDLTARLVSLAEENRALTVALDEARGEAQAAIASAQAVHAVTGTKVFRLAVGVQRLRAGLRSR